MTDIEALRSNVINAARACRDHWNDPSPVGIAFETDLMDAVDALDAAEKPDPWELLRRVHYALDGDPGDVSCSPLHEEIEEALEWHDKQEADA